jgi:hypothetical protein
MLPFFWKPAWVIAKDDKETILTLSFSLSYHYGLAALVAEPLD